MTQIKKTSERVCMVFAVAEYEHCEKRTYPQQVLGIDKTSGLVEDNPFSTSSEKQYPQKEFVMIHFINRAGFR